MKKVMTINGEIPVTDMGFTDAHTHIRVKFPDGFRWSDRKEKSLEINIENIHDLQRGFWAYSDESYELCDENIVTEELKCFSDAGGKTIVEASPAGARVDINMMKRISDKLGINIILSSGFSADGLWPEKLTSYNRNELVGFLLNEVENGLDGTSYRPGQMKMSCNKFNDFEKKAVTAASIAAAETGLCCQVHTGSGLNPDITCQISEIIKSQGVDLEKVIFLHMDQFVTQSDLNEYIKNHKEATVLKLDGIRRVLATGATISFDCFGNNENIEKEFYVKASDYDRLAALYTLIKEGYSKQIVLGTDVFQQLYYRKYGGSGYMRIKEFVIPALREVGVSESDINNMTIGNPARLYGRNHF